MRHKEGMHFQIRLPTHSQSVEIQYAMYLNQQLHLKWFEEMNPNLTKSRMNVVEYLNALMLQLLLLQFVVDEEMLQQRPTLHDFHQPYDDESVIYVKPQEL